MPLSAKAQLQRDGNAIRVTQLDARTTGKRPLGLASEGQLTLADITAEPSVTDVDLGLTAKGPNAESVASLVGPLPIDPGPWRLETQIKGKTGALRAEAIKFDSGKDDSVRLKVEGSISDLERLISSAGKTPTGVRFKGHVAAVSTQQLGGTRSDPHRLFDQKGWT